MTCMSAILIGSLTSQINAAPLSPFPRQTATGTAWSDGTIKKLFIFGDSWSDTGFNIGGVQPSPAQPLGNPPLGGNTINDGKWPVYLTTKYNATFLETYNFAQSGATLNASIIPHGPDVASQLEKEFLPYYSARNASSWESDNALFAIFIGINDVNVMLQMLNTTTQAIIAEEFASYANVLEQLYGTGARNFLLVNVPPLQRAPQGQASVAAVIEEWNTMVTDAGNNLTKAHGDTHVWYFDENTYLNQVIDNPKTFPQTAGIVNTTGYCSAYASMNEALDFSDPSCGVPLDQYLWINNLHKTSPAHDGMAAQIAETLSA